MNDDVRFIVDLKKLYIAGILSDTASETTYDTPTYYPGVKEIGVKAKVNIDNGYAEGVVWDTESTIESIDVDINIVDLTADEEAMLLGHKLSEEGGVIYNSSDKAPEVALLAKALKSNGKARYISLLRGSFADGDESYKGKEGKTDFQSKSLVGSFAPTKSNGNWKYKVDEEQGMTDEKFFSTVIMPTPKTETTEKTEPDKAEPTE